MHFILYCIQNMKRMVLCIPYDNLMSQAHVVKKKSPAVPVVPCLCLVRSSGGIQLSMSSATDPVPMLLHHREWQAKPED